MIYQGRLEPVGPHDHLRKNGEDELVSAEMSDKNQNPKRSQVQPSPGPHQNFGPARVQIDFPPIFQVFDSPKVSIRRRRIQAGATDSRGAWLRASIHWPNRQSDSVVQSTKSHIPIIGLGLNRYAVGGGAAVVSA
jgi:hypothetical protein